MTSIRLLAYCGQGVIRITFDDVLYEFTVGVPVSVPTALADALVAFVRPCGLGIFEAVI